MKISCIIATDLFQPLPHPEVVCLQLKPYTEGLLQSQASSLHIKPELNHLQDCSPKHATTMLHVNKVRLTGLLHVPQILFAQDPKKVK